MKKSKLFKISFLALGIITTSGITAPVLVSNTFKNSENHNLLKSENTFNADNVITVSNWNIENDSAGNKKLVSGDDARFVFNVALEGPETGYTTVRIDGFNPVGLTQNDPFYLDFSHVNFNLASDYTFSLTSSELPFHDSLTNSKRYNDMFCNYSLIAINTGLLTNIQEFALSCNFKLTTLIIGPKLEIERFESIQGGLISLNNIQVNGNPNFVLATNDDGTGQQLFVKNDIVAGDIPVIGRDPFWIAWGRVNLSSDVSVVSNIFGSCFEDQAAIYEVVVPEGVTELNITFKRCYNLQTLLLPNSLVKLLDADQSYMFAWCPNLQQLWLPDNLQVLNVSDNDITGTIENFDDTYWDGNNGSLKAVRIGGKLSISNFKMSGITGTFHPNQFVFGSSISQTDGFYFFSSDKFQIDSQLQLSSFWDYYYNNGLDIVFQGDVNNLNFSDPNHFIFDTSSGTNFVNLARINTKIYFNSQQELDVFKNNHLSFLSNPSKYSNITLLVSNLQIQNKFDNVLTIDPDQAGEKQFNASITPNFNFKNQLLWRLEDSPNTTVPIPNELTIDQTSGLLSWTDTIPVGSYNFRVVCQQVGSVNKEDTLDFTLNVGDPFLPRLSEISGSDIVNGIYGEITQEVYFCNILNPSQIDPNLRMVWSLSENLNGVRINSDDGVLTINRNAGYLNQKAIQIICRVGQVVKTKDIMINNEYQEPTFNDVDPIQGPDTISGTSGLLTRVVYSCEVTNINYINPSLTLQWSINWNGNFSPNGIEISNDGVLTINRDTFVFGSIEIGIICQVGNFSKEKIISIENKERSLSNSQQLIIGLATPAIILVVVALCTVVFVISKRRYL